MFLSSGRTGTTKTPARQHVPLAEGLAQHARHEPHPGDRALRPACRHPGGELLPLAPQQYRPTTPLNRLRGQDHPKPASLTAAAASTRLAQTGRPSPGSRPKPRLPPSRVIRLAGPRPRAARPSRSSTRDSNPAGGSLTGNSPSSSSPVTVSRQTFSWHAAQRSRCATAAARSRPVRAPSASSAVTSANPAHPIWFSSLTVCTPRRQAARNSCKPSLIRVTSAPGVSRPRRALPGGSRRGTQIADDGPFGTGREPLEAARERPAGAACATACWRYLARQAVSRSSVPVHTLHTGRHPQRIDRDRRSAAIPTTAVTAVEVRGLPGQLPC